MTDQESEAATQTEQPTEPTEPSAQAVADSLEPPDHFPYFGVLTGSLIAVAAVVFREISTFLLRVEGSSHAYGPGVFTGWKIKVTDTDDLLAAAGPEGVWTTNAPAGPFVSWHITIDILFMAVLALALGRILFVVGRRKSVQAGEDALGPRRPILVGLPLAYFFADLAETLYTRWALNCHWLGHGCDFQLEESHAWPIHLLSNVKWLALIVTVIVIIGLYFNGRGKGRVSWQRRRELRKYAADRQRVDGPPVGAVVVVLLLAILIAVPGGGALDQMPDVLRAQIDDAQAGDTDQVLASLWALLLFLGVLHVVAFSVIRRTPTEASELDETGSDPESSDEEPEEAGPAAPKAVPWWVVLPVAAAVSGGLLALHRHLEGSPGQLTALATFLVVLVIAVVSVVANWFAGQLGSDDDGDADQEQDQDDGWTEEQLDTIRRAAVRNEDDRATVTAGVLVGLVILAGALALVRATLPLFMNEGISEEAEQQVLGWSLAVAILAPMPVSRLAVSLFRLEARSDFAWWVRVVVCAAAVLVTASFTVKLAWHPADAGKYGAPATVLISLSAWLIVVGFFAWLSRRVVWHSTLALGLGRRRGRTPWMAIAVIIWLVAGAVDSTGGYHDTRTVDLSETEAGSPASMRTLDEAFETWADQFQDASTLSCRAPDGGATGADPRTVPLVLVAAPGGGGKAAYWTALAMDKTFGPDGFCPKSLFAASGVSGGAVGLTTALSLAPASSGDTVANMVKEGPLSRALAAMLLRDIPQPLTSMRGEWTDRATELEEGWADAAPEAFGDDGDKSLLDVGDGWWSSATGTPLTDQGPVLLLNGSSVNDGCRVLVTNVRGAAAGNDGCLSLARGSTDFAPQGAVSGSVDAVSGLLPSLRATNDEPYQHKDTDPADVCIADDREAQTVRATTAALLAARFPVVTPSGAMNRCISAETNLGTKRLEPAQRIETDYVVDGGYLENTGILSLAQLWSAAEGRVTRCNTAASAGLVIEHCPHDGAQPLWIEPWFVMMENHYRSSVAPPPSYNRPRELLVPLLAATKRGTTLDTIPLEQHLALTVSRALSNADGSASPIASCNRFIRLAPRQAPTVEAPLGWVLADGTRTRMQERLEDTWGFNLGYVLRSDVGDEEGKHVYFQDRCPVTGGS